MIEFPLTIPLAVMTKMSWLRSPVLTNIPVETLGARSSLGGLGLNKRCSPKLTSGILQLLPKVRSHPVQSGTW